MDDSLINTANVEIIKSAGGFESSRLNYSLELTELDAVETNKILPQYSPEELARYYQINSYHQRCVQTKALVTAGLGFELVLKNNTTAIEENNNNTERKSINEFITQNEKTTGETFIEMLIKFQTDFEVFGYAFLEIVKGLNGMMKEIYHLPCKHCKLAKDETSGGIKLLQTINNKTQTFAPGEFVMIKNYNPDNRYYGLPEYISSLPAILLDREMMEYNISRIQNNAIPDLIVSVSGTQLTQAQKDTMKDFWSNNFKGANNSGKTLLIETTARDSQIQVTEIKSTYRDGAFRLAKRECRDEIIACHGVPPILLGIKTSGSIGSGKDIIEQMRTFKEIIIEPRQRRLEHLLNTLFYNELGIQNTEIKFKNINIADLANYKEAQ